MSDSEELNKSAIEFLTPSHKDFLANWLTVPENKKPIKQMLTDINYIQKRVKLKWRVKAGNKFPVCIYDLSTNVMYGGPYIFYYASPNSKNERSCNVV